jgi:hypothetical protein
MTRSLCRDSLAVTASQSTPSRLSRPEVPVDSTSSHRAAALFEVTTALWLQAASHSAVCSRRPGGPGPGMLHRRRPWPSGSGVAVTEPRTIQTISWLSCGARESIRWRAARRLACRGGLHVRRGRRPGLAGDRGRGGGCAASCHGAPANGSVLLCRPSARLVMRAGHKCRHMHLFVCACACVRACLPACVPACLRACAPARLRACACACACVRAWCVCVFANG